MLQKPAVHDSFDFILVLLDFCWWKSDLLEFYRDWMSTIWKPSAVVSPELYEISKSVDYITEIYYGEVNQCHGVVSILRAVLCLSILTMPVVMELRPRPYSVELQCITDGMETSSVVPEPNMPVASNYVLDIWHWTNEVLKTTTNSSITGTDVTNHDSAVSHYKICNVTG